MEVKDTQKSEESFFEDVYAVVRLIPPGRVTSYGAIAAYLGAKGSARMVGWALASSHMHARIPAHRVLNRQGLLTGRHHFKTQHAMQDLLEKEGLAIKAHQVEDFDTHFWDPVHELSL